MLRQFFSINFPKVLGNYCPALNYRPVRDNNYPNIFEIHFYKHYLTIFLRLLTKHRERKQRKEKRKRREEKRREEKRGYEMI